MLPITWWLAADCLDIARVNLEFESLNRLPGPSFCEDVPLFLDQSFDFAFHGLGAPVEPYIVLKFLEVCCLLKDLDIVSLW